MVETLVDVDDGDMTNEHDTPDSGFDSGIAAEASDSDTLLDESVPTPPPPGSQPPPAASGQPFPPSGPASPQMGLVRDPYAALGGIASGVAHRYGWSVALVRLSFVAVFLASCGFATLLYLAAWIIVPRARFWPPAVVGGPGEQLRGRDVGIAVVALGVIALLVVGGGNAASVLVPLALVGGGIWLLAQNQRADTLPPPAAADAVPNAGPIPTFATEPAPLGMPVAPVTRKRKWLFRSLIVGAVLALIALIALPIALISEVEWDDVTYTIGNDDFLAARYAPDTILELPSRISTDNGRIEVDLTNIPAAEFADLTEPIPLDLRVGAGDIDLVLPAGLDVAVDAQAGTGSIDVSGADLVGATISGDSVKATGADPVVIITATVDDGSIEIETRP